jgi:TonB family protein
MNATLLFSLQTIISAGVFILIYRLFVRNTNAYNWNRFYLLSTMIISLFLPHVNISGWFTVAKPVIFYGSLIDFNQAVTISPVAQIQNTFNLSDLIMTGYWLVAIFLLLRFGWGIMRILELAKNDDYKKSGNLRLYPIQRKTTFSFFNWIFIQPQHWEKPSIDYIIRHEQAHVKQMHSLDNLLTELILVFGWFNPFYYIYRCDLHLLHECQADQVVINSGCDTATYHQLLMNEVSGNLTYIIVNQFSYSLIKRRFKMISKNKQSRLAGFRILLAIPTAFALLLLFSFTSLDKTKSLLKDKIQQVQTSINSLQNRGTKETIKFTPPEIQQKDTSKRNNELVDNMYKRGFPGGYNAFMDFFKNNFKFPSQSVRKDYTSYIDVKFDISESSEISNIKIVKGLDEFCDAEVVRLINNMPKWTPYLSEGKPVSIQASMHIGIKMDPAYPSNSPIVNIGAAIGKKPSIDPNDEKPLLVVQQNPDFKGGYTAMQTFLKENINYPDVASKEGIQGTVFVQFVISKYGKISNVKILRGIGGGCDEEAVRVVKIMPDWIPGINDGKEVPVMFQIPVKFQLVKPNPTVQLNPDNEEIKPMVDKNGNKTNMEMEQKPEFPGGYNGVMKFISDHTKYPPLAQNSGIQGTVYVQFLIDKTGQTSQAKVLRGIGGGCDEEAVRVVKEMPKWIPGKQNGQPVNSVYQIPVKFQLATK